VDAAGAVYIAYLRNRRIRKVSPDGLITSFTGNSNPDCGPSGVPKVYAQVESLAGVAVGAAGAVYMPTDLIAVFSPQFFLTPILSF
jgi:hypothetical protein